MNSKKKFLFLSCLIITCFVLFNTNPVFAKSKKPKLNKTKITLTIGKTATLTVKNSKKRFKWSSSNKKIVSVSSKGIIKARKKGTAKIFAKRAKTKLVCKVTVKNIPSVKMERIEPSVSSQIANLSVSLFQKSTQNSLKNRENIMISPYSISLAMLMTTNGSQGDTQKQLENTLCGSYALNTVNNYMSTLNQNLTNKKPDNTAFHSANSIWMNQELGTLNQDFVTTNQDLFDAAINNRLFDSATCSEINDWIFQNTNGMINNPLSQLDEDAAIVLVNALAFEANWQKKYNQSCIKSNEIFTKEDGTKESATMLYETTKNNYFEDKNVSGFVKNYNDGYAFMALLPKKGQTIESCVANLTGEKLMQYYKIHTKAPRGYEYVVHTKLPKFSFDYDNANVIDALQQMGVTNAFDETKADFGNMATLFNPVSNLYIGDIIHKTHIELDENGTKAAATTIIVSKVTSTAPDHLTPIDKYVYLDRPFIFVIMDCEKNTPLFIGAVHSVNE